MNRQHDRTAVAFAREIVDHLHKAGCTNPDQFALLDLITHWVMQNYTTKHANVMRAMVRATAGHVATMREQDAA